MSGWRFGAGSLLLALLVVAGLAAAPLSASAAEPAAEPAAGTALSAEELSALVEQARAKGVRIIVVAPDGAASAASTSDGGPGAAIARLRSELRTLAAELPGAPGRILTALRDTSPDGTLGHHLLVMLGMIAIMVAAAVPEWLYGGWLKTKMRAIWPEATPHLSDKMCFLLLRFCGRLLGICLFALVAVAIAAAFYEESRSNEITLGILLAGVVTARAVVEFWRVWISPTLPEFRLPPLPDEEAGRLFAWLVAMTVVGCAGLSLGFWLEDLIGREPAVVAAQLALFLVVFLFALVTLGAVRPSVTALIVGPEAGQSAGAGPGVGRGAKLRHLLGANWQFAMVLYLTVAWFATSARILLDQPDALGPSFGMMVVLAATLTLFSVAVVLLDWLFYRRKGAPRRLEAEAAAAAVDPALGADDLQEPAIEEDSDDAPSEPPRGLFGGVRSFEDLAKQSVYLLLFVFVIGGLMVAWGVDVTDSQSPLVRLWDVIFVVFAGYVAMQSARIWIQRKIDQEGGAVEPEPGEEGAAGGVSRLATLLPLFRNFILATIVAFVVMIGLSEMGIDIAPLFAGAGVVGLAIGFGAQALIRDIFSGAFFLFDDAFRKGEYIDIGSVQGTVERISLRSMQVRHHNGPLHTVPFGEIKHLTNFSRDWVMMKLKLRVTYDTDVEKVRKLIKALGKELQADPEIGAMFLQPLKSQGVLAMEDSAMIIRVKFMTRPGDQFVTRRKVYAAIQELFAREGIKFAHREVTVRVADDQARKEAIVGAVAPVLDEAAAPAGGTDQR